MYVPNDKNIIISAASIFIFKNKGLSASILHEIR